MRNGVLNIRKKKIFNIKKIISENFDIINLCLYRIYIFKT